MPKNSRDKHNKGRVRRLWGICKHCHWCGRETRLQQSGLSHAADDIATFDHIYHRSEPERKKFPHRGVLACYGCNQRRGREAHIRTLPLWNQWVIAAGLHRPLYHVKKAFYTFARSRGLIK